MVKLLLRHRRQAVFLALVVDHPIPSMPGLAKWKFMNSAPAFLNMAFMNPSLKLVGIH